MSLSMCQGDVPGTVTTKNTKGTKKFCVFRVFRGSSILSSQWSRCSTGEYRSENARPVLKFHAVTPPLPITRCRVCALLEWERGLGGEGKRYGHPSLPNYSHKSVNIYILLVDDLGYDEDGRIADYADYADYWFSG